jgi:hypothetical protein
MTGTIIIDGTTLQKFTKQDGMVVVSGSSKRPLQGPLRQSG